MQKETHADLGNMIQSMMSTLFAASQFLSSILYRHPQRPAGQRRFGRAVNVGGGLRRSKQPHHLRGPTRSANPGRLALLDLWTDRGNRWAHRHRRDLDAGLWALPCPDKPAFARWGHAACRSRYNHLVRRRQGAAGQRPTAESGCAQRPGHFYKGPGVGLGLPIL